MAGGVTTVRLHIVVTNAAKVTANNTLRLIDPTSVGDPITVPLRVAGDASNTVVAWGASWAMEDVTAQAAGVAARGAGWSPRLSNNEYTIYTPEEPVPAFGSGQRIWLWNGYLIGFRACLTMLGLDVPNSSVG